MLTINNFQQAKAVDQESAEQILERINGILETAPAKGQIAPVFAALSGANVITLKAALGYPEDKFLKKRDLTWDLVKAYNAFAGDQD